MTTLSELKQQKEDKVSALIKECGVFFAFSNEQFAENKTPLQEGEKYLRMGMGGFIPASKAKQYGDGVESIIVWYKDAIRDNKLRREEIIYELGNHEAWYTYDIEDTLMALGSDYTESEVMQVLREEYENQTT